jgi:hypothetical protein
MPKPRLRVVAQEVEQLDKRASQQEQTVNLDRETGAEMEARIMSRAVVEAHLVLGSMQLQVLEVPVDLV